MRGNAAPSWNAFGGTFLWKCIWGSTSVTHKYRYLRCKIAPNWQYHFPDVPVRLLFAFTSHVPRVSFQMNPCSQLWNNLFSTTKKMDYIFTVMDCVAQESGLNKLVFRPQRNERKPTVTYSIRQEMCNSSGMLWKTVSRIHDICLVNKKELRKQVWLIEGRGIDKWIIPQESIAD